MLIPDDSLSSRDCSSAEGAFSSSQVKPNKYNKNQSKVSYQRVDTRHEPIQLSEPLNHNDNTTNSGTVLLPKPLTFHVDSG